MQNYSKPAAGRQAAGAAGIKSTIATPSKAIPKGKSAAPVASGGAKSAAKGFSGGLHPSKV